MCSPHQNPAVLASRGLPVHCADLHCHTRGLTATHLTDPWPSVSIKSCQFYLQSVYAVSCMRFHHQYPNSSISSLTQQRPLLAPGSCTSAAHPLRVVLHCVSSLHPACFSLHKAVCSPSPPGSSYSLLMTQVKLHSVKNAFLTSLTRLVTLPLYALKYYLHHCLNFALPPHHSVSSWRVDTW